MYSLQKIEGDLNQNSLKVKGESNQTQAGLKMSKMSKFVIIWLSTNIHEK